MATRGSADVGFLIIGGYDLLGDSTTLDTAIEQVLEETTPLGAAWPTHAQAGLKRGTFAQGGFYNDATGKSNEALVSLSGTARVGLVSHAGNTIGRNFQGFAGLVQSKYQRQVSLGALHKGQSEHAVTGQFEEGVILHALGAETAASGNTDASSVDNGASSANGGAAYFAVTALVLGGYTNVALKVRHSADDVTYADLATATVVTAAPAAERVAVAGTVNRHLYASWAFNGAGAGQSVTFVAGFCRG